MLKILNVNNFPLDFNTYQLSKKKQQKATATVWITVAVAFCSI
jgi:hypothetical protein